MNIHVRLQNNVSKQHYHRFLCHYERNYKMINFLCQKDSIFTYLKNAQILRFAGKSKHLSPRFFIVILVVVISQQHLVLINHPCASHASHQLFCPPNLLFLIVYLFINGWGHCVVRLETFYKWIRYVVKGNGELKCGPFLFLLKPNMTCSLASCDGVNFYNRVSRMIGKHQ